MRIRWARVLTWIGAVVVALVAFTFWYRATYSMAVARPFEVPGASTGPRVLIATQGSAFKDAVVAGVVDRMKARNVGVSVIDVSGLGPVREDEWSAIVVIHTWEMRKPPSAVGAFVNRARDKHKLVVLTTSGQGSFRLEGVDAIASASRDEDVPARVEAIVGRINAILDAPPGAG